VQLEACILALAQQTKKLSVSYITPHSMSQGNRIKLHMLVTQLEPLAMLQRTHSFHSPHTVVAAVM